MSLLNKASLIQIPSGYKDGTLYSAKPTNGDGDFTFSRGSNLAATRVNSDGLIEKGRENLLLQSNQFDTTWVTANSSVTSGQSGYDGSNDAWLLDKSGASGRITQTKSVTGIFTFSVYVKKGTTDYILLYKTGTGEGGRFFDLTNGVTGSSISTAPIDSKIESVGNDWYRCSIVGNSANAVVMYVADSDGSLTDTSGNIYIQDAQLEVGLVSTDVITTTTTTEQAGILEDMPRLDYSGGASCPSCLLEPQRSNLITQSELFDSSDWTKLGAGTGDTAIVTTNYAISPEGLQNATRLQCDLNGGGTSSSNQSLIYDVYSGSGSQTISIYAKSNTGENQTIYFANTQTTGDTITVTPEWQRFTFTHSSSPYVFAIGLRGRTGGAINDTADILIYGAMAESSASYPTSYIPTYGASVTRGADSWYVDNLNQTTAYTIFIDYEFLEEADANFQDYISFQTSGSNQDGLRAEGVGSDWRLYGYNISGSVSFPINGSVSAKKKAIVVSSQGIKLFEDGALADEDLSGMTVPTLGAIVSKRGTSAPYPTEIKQGYNQLIVFSTALSDDECIQLTTL